MSWNLVGICVVSLFLPIGSAQEPFHDSSGSAKLTITLNTRGAATISLRAYDRHIAAGLTQPANQLLGCILQSVKERESEDDWVFSGRCDDAFRRRGLLAGGTINLGPLVTVLHQAKVGRIDVTIRHPRTGFSTLTDNAWRYETSSQSADYSKSFPTEIAPAAINLAYGYRAVNFLPLTLLLFPVALAMILRWAALRFKQTDLASVWFTYWRLLGWVITAGWLLWVQGSTVIDCAALARFLLNDSPKSPLLQLAFYLVPPVLVQFVATVASGAVLARVRGEPQVLPVTARHAFWHEPVNVLPLLCLLAGVASLALFDEWLLGAACLAVAYASHVVLVWIWFHFQALRRYELPSGDLRSNILALAQKAGVKLKGIYLLPASEGRLASPLMFRRGRLLLSDVMIRALRPGEVEAVLAREFVHIRRHHRDLVLGGVVLALPIIYRFSHMPLLAAKLPWAVRGPLLVWVTPILLYLLWRRFEAQAQQEAVRLVGRDAMAGALPKLARFNLLGLYWKSFEQRFFPYGIVCDWRQTLEAEESQASGTPAMATADSGGRPRFVSAD